MLRFAAALALAAAAAVGAPAPARAASADGAMPPFPADASQAAAMVWLKRNTSLGVGRYVIFGPDNVLVVTEDEVSTRAPNLHRVAFRQEAVNIDFVGRSGGRSLRGEGEVDCTAGSFKAGVTELYAGTDLKGPLVHRLKPESEAQRAPAGTATAELVMAVCGPGQAALSALAGDRADPAPVAAQPVPAAPEAAAPPPPAPAPRPAPRPRREASGRTAPAAPAPAPAAAGAAITAQVGAFADQEAAERAWRDLARDFPEDFAGKTMRIDTGTAIGGGAVYRAQVTGFSNRAEAEALCRRLMSSSRGCFVRKGP